MISKEILVKIEELTKANANIGYYDHLRYKEVKKQKNKVDKELLYVASRKVRSINESRSRFKNNLDNLLSLYVEKYRKRQEW